MELESSFLSNGVRVYSSIAPSFIFIAVFLQGNKKKRLIENVHWIITCVHNLCNNIKLVEKLRE